MTSEARGQWFATAMAAIARRLPFGLSGVVPPNVVGYLLINGCTFCLDLSLLTLFHGVFGVMLPVAVTLSYGLASLVSYTANRILNFQSHGSVGTQLPLYVGILTVNYLVFILGVVDGLAAIGVEYQAARVIAACGEGVFLYCCMRWLVFRDAMGSTPAGPHHVAEAAAAPAPAAAPASVPRPEAPRPAVPATPEGS
jgi:putative flippase GtrA